MPTPPEQRSSWTAAQLPLQLLAFLALATTTYSNALRMAFFGDDVARLTENLATFQAGLLATLTSIMPDRPILLASMWANFRLANGFDIFSFRLTNVLLHGTAGFVLFRLMLVLRPDELRGLRTKCLAAAVALLFVAHAAHNQAVNLVIQRGVLLVTLFSLLTLLCHAHARRPGLAQAEARPWLLGAYLSFLFALTSKTSAAGLPFLILLYETQVLGQTLERSLRRLWPYFVALIIPAVIYFGLGASSQRSEMGALSYLSIQLRVVFLYFKLLVWPVGLHYMHDVSTDSNLLHNLTWLALLGHAAILLLAFGFRNRNQLLAFAIFAAYLAFVPESGVFPILDVVFEHRTHLPFAFLHLALFFALIQLKPRRAWIAQACLAVAIVGNVAVARARNHEIDTPKKWLFNTWSYNRTSANFNLRTLSDLFFVGAFQDGAAGLQMIREVAAPLPDYELYAKVFAPPGLHQEQRLANIDTIANTLLQIGQTKLNMQTRLTMNMFVVGEVAHRFQEPTRSRKIEQLLFPQLPVLSMNPGYFSPLLRQYNVVLNILRDDYAARTAQRRLPETQSLHYLRVLSILQLLFGQPTADLSQRYEAHLKRYPGSAAAQQQFAWFQAAVGH